MANQLFSREIERNLATLSEQLEELTVLCERLGSENQRLTTEHGSLLAERDSLATEHQQARARIDAIVARLKGVGHAA